MGIGAEDFWGDHTVLRGSRWGGSVVATVYKGGLYKIDCQITTNEGGRGGVGASGILILTQPKSSNCSNPLPLSLLR